jgi:glycosyltransferase involved in cell wall biosynthesis
LKLTVGMATYDDFDALFFTVQHLRAFHLDDTDEILIIDNFGCDTTRDFAAAVPSLRYIRWTEKQGTAAPRQHIFDEATGDIVVCLDSHVLLLPGAIAALKDYFAKNPESIDLVQGPLVSDDFSSAFTHFSTEWDSHMYGQWQYDERGNDPAHPPFEIPNMGLGAFACRKEAWPGFNPLFRGFGGEEGYLHEKFRQRGGRTICLPAFRWNHKFWRPRGVPHKVYDFDKYRNHIIGWEENGCDLTEVVNHFSDTMKPEDLAKIAKEALDEAGRSHFYDFEQLFLHAGVPFSAEHAQPEAPSTPNHPRIACYLVLDEATPVSIDQLRSIVRSFLESTYPNATLFIINNDRSRQIKTYAAGVRVITPQSRLRTVESIGRFLLNHTGAEFIATWPIDRIPSPSRLTHLQEGIGNADMIEEITDTPSEQFSGLFTRDAFVALTKPLVSAHSQEDETFTIAYSETPEAPNTQSAPVNCMTPAPIWVSNA